MNIDSYIVQPKKYNSSKDTDFSLFFVILLSTATDYTKISKGFPLKFSYNFTCITMPDETKEFPFCFLSQLYFINSIF